MGRKSALSPEQWLQIERRMLVDGESAYALSKEFGVNESSIRRKIKPSSADKAEAGTKHHPELRELAERKVEVDRAKQSVDAEIAALPVARQEIVSDLAQRLQNISRHLCGAAEFGAATAHRLAGIAHLKVQQIDDADPFAAESMLALKGVTVLTNMANEASKIGLNLINANKDTIRDVDDTPPAPVRIVIESVDASADQA